MHTVARVLRSFTFAIDPEERLTVRLGAYREEGSADTGELSLDLSHLLVALGEGAQEHGRGVVLLIDETQFLSKAQLDAAVMGIHRTVQRELLITLVGAGLSQIAELAGGGRSRILSGSSSFHALTTSTMTALMQRSRNLPA